MATQMQCMKIGGGQNVIKYPNIMGDSKGIAFFATNNINTQSTFIKRDLFKQYGLFDTAYKIASDYDRWLRFYCESKKFYHLPFIVANYDMNGISNTNKTLCDKEGKEILLKYFSQEQINEAIDKHCSKYSFMERIFSIKNAPSKSHKVLMIFGMRFLFKRS